MPGYAAIAATSSTLVELLDSARGNTEFSTTTVSLFQPRDFAGTPDDTVSLYLFRAIVNGASRNVRPPRRLDGKRELAPLPLDLYYLLTAWALNPLRQHRLLGWAARTIADAPVVPAALLNGQSPDGPVFQEDYSLELIFESLSIQDMASVWELNKANQRPSFVLIARLVPLRSDVLLEDAGPVQTRVIQGQPEAAA